jgi:hypothetical protein
MKVTFWHGGLRKDKGECLTNPGFYRPPGIAVLALSFGEFAGSPWRSFVHQAGHALEEILIAVITHGLLTEREHLSHVADALALSQGQEGMDAFDQFHRAAGVGLLETTQELLAGEGAQV